ncbi:DMT family transporter [Povalibacter sp.]|uniref:DMT family transporter n=1 Tax=Povalibacter sp. TaxID=1962978 RepID=UPI002F42EFB8
MNRRWRAILMLIGVMTLWGSVFVMTKDIIDVVPPLTLAFMRVAIGFLVLLPFAIYRLRRQPSPRPPLPWRAMLTMGLIGVAFYYGMFNLGLFYTSASQGALVQSSIPAMTALVAILWLGEPATRSRVAGIGLSVVGVLVIFSGSPVDTSAAAPVLGNVLVFVSVIAWGVYTSYAKRCAHVDAMILTAGVIGAGALFLLPFALIELRGQSLPVLDTVEWMEVILLGAGASGLAYMFYNLALQDIDASQAGVFANLIPVVGVASGIAVLGDPISVRAIIGGVIVIAGIWITGGAETPRTIDS